MVEDFYIKPLQGGQLYRLQDVIMGKHKTMLPEECVETDRDNVRKLVSTSDGWHKDTYGRKKNPREEENNIKCQ